MIYLLKPRLDDPRFEGFDGEMTTFLSTPGGRRTSRELEIKKLAPDWSRPRVKGIVRDINHYPCVNLSIPVFSRHAVNCLREMLEPNGELLPIDSSCGEYYFFNLTKVADILDVDRSDIVWLKRPIIAGIIKHHEFRAGGLEQLQIFRIPENPSEIYVTEQFVDKAFQSKLTGMQFIKVWPVIHGAPSEIRQVPIGKASKGANRTNSSLAEAKAQSVYLYTSHKSKELQNAEVDELAEGIRKMLLPSNSRLFSIGHLEYIDDEDEAFRFIFSCPNSEELVLRLKEHLKAVNWNGATRIIRRLGRYDDAGATEFDVTG